METLILLINWLINYLVQGIDWLVSLYPDQIVRVFWAFLFLEIPRYAITNAFVFVLYLLERNNGNGGSRILRDQPLVSVIVPALNEERTIAHTVSSLLEQDYRNIEVILVDDGSTDRTKAVCQYLGTRGRVRCYHLNERQGKSAAINFGLNVSKGEYVVLMDSDSTLDRDAIRNLIKYFDDDNVGVVSGNLGVRNLEVNLLTRLQAVEYLITITIGRRFKAAIGILSIAPGAIGAFRRSLLERIGLLEPGPGNDSDVTIRTRKLGKQVAFAHDATCLTNAPETWSAWIRQRMRWDRNIVRNRVRKHRDIFDLTQAHFRLSNFVSFVDNLFFGAFLPTIWLIYLVDMALHYPREYGYILLAVFITQLFLHFIRIIIALTVSRPHLEPADIVLTFPFYGLYRVGVKLLRIVAVLQELLFRSSYRDPFAPEKVRKQMEVY